MVREKAGRTVQRIKQLAEAGQYRYSAHAWDEMDDDSVFDEDVLQAIRKGRLAAKLTGDPRGPRYLLAGPTTDGRQVEVVCRIVGGRVRIVTVYLVR